MPPRLRFPAMTQPWELAVSGPDQIRLARHAEKLGFEMVCVPEHFAMPRAHAALSDQQWADIVARIPMQRLGTPEDVAAAIGFLASPAAGYVTGQCLHVSGGIVM